MLNSLRALKVCMDHAMVRLAHHERVAITMCKFLGSPFATLRVWWGGGCQQAISPPDSSPACGGFRMTFSQVPWSENPHTELADLRSSRELVKG